MSGCFLTFLTIVQVVVRTDLARSMSSRYPFFRGFTAVINPNFLSACQENVHYGQWSPESYLSEHWRMEFLPYALPGPESCKCLKWEIFAVYFHYFNFTMNRAEFKRRKWIIFTKRSCIMVKIACIFCFSVGLYYTLNLMS